MLGLLAHGEVYVILLYGTGSVKPVRDWRGAGMGSLGSVVDTFGSVANDVGSVGNFGSAVWAGILPTLTPEALKSGPLIFCFFTVGVVSLEPEFALI